MRRNYLYFLSSSSLLLILWWGLSEAKFYNSENFPYFETFALSLGHELLTGRLFIDLFASLFRWFSGFFLAVIMGIPVGLVLGRKKNLLDFLFPYLNLLRSLSPLAWIPFAVIWFGIGDLPVVFLIFLGCVFPLIFTTLSALQNVPKVYDELARDYGFKGQEYFSDILLPAILPQVVASLRLVAGLGWIVLVPAEMLAGQEGLGFAILDARNGLRTDLLLINMMVVAFVSHSIDLLMGKLNQLSHVKWGHEQ